MIARTPLVLGKKSHHQITEEISQVVEGKPTKGWLALVGSTGFLMTIWLLTLLSLFTVGMGLLGLNHPIGWATDIITFVFWIGIGHAGTLISAILFLFRQKWRVGIARTAEAMTIFAVMTALVYPIFHTGRPWLAAFWLLPYPNQRGPLWTNPRSPLEWDVFAVSTYFTVSLVFWYMGMVPDLATLRDRAKAAGKKLRHMIYGALSLGWRGNNRNWQNYESMYLILAALSTPLVLSVHSIVSFDFAVSLLPGWHTTIFPPYFVAGAIFSGFGMVVTLMVIVRETIPVMKDYITIDHMEVMNKVIMATGLMVGYAYGTEFFIAWYSGSEYETFIFWNRAFGPYGWSYWIMITCNVFIPQVFWKKEWRRNIKIMFIVSIFVNIGMWFERFVIIVTSLHRDFLPSNWGMYNFTIFDYTFLFGSFGFFLTSFLLFIKFLPMVAIAEVKPIKDVGHGGGHHG